MTCIAYRILLTIHVAVAYAERSFPKLKFNFNTVQLQKLFFAATNRMGTHHIVAHNIIG
jgi:hypothetical protein